MGSSDTGGFVRGLAILGVERDEPNLEKQLATFSA